MQESFPSGSETLFKFQSGKYSLGKTKSIGLADRINKSRLLSVILAWADFLNS